MGLRAASRSLRRSLASRSTSNEGRTTRIRVARDEAYAAAAGCQCEVVPWSGEGSLALSNSNTFQCRQSPFTIHLPLPVKCYNSRSPAVKDRRLPPARNWHLLPHDAVAVDRLAHSLGVGPIVAQLLLNRNLTEPESAKRFLDAPLKGLHPPELLPGVTVAAQRIFDAVQAKRRICIYGDYDVDGTTGTAILLQVLRLLGAEPDFYVPHRLEEGYGVNAEALRQIAANGSQMVVTVDCGIASVAEAEVARELELEFIVTDHHEPKAQRPGAAVIVHPRVPAGLYPFEGLSGSGVALKLAWKLAPTWQRWRQGHAALSRIFARRGCPGDPRHRRRRGSFTR